MQRKLFWLGFTALSFVCGFLFSLMTGFLMTIVAGAGWWWVVYKSGYISN